MNENKALREQIKTKLEGVKTGIDNLEEMADQSYEKENKKNLWRHSAEARI